jgi:hypothetical protein
LQGDDGDFWRTVDADRNVDGADAAADEERRPVALQDACGNRKFLSRHRAECRQDDLSAVCMPRENQRNLERDRFRDAPWIVCEQDGRARRAAKY